MNRKVTTAVLPLFLALPLAGCGGEKEAAPAVVRTVRVMKIGATAAEGSLSFPGEVRPRYESRLGFRIGGKIVSRAVDVGVRVKRGQVLARLDGQDVALQAAQAEANRVLADAEARRYRDLRAKNFVSQAVLDAKETTLKTAEAQAGVAKNQAAYALLTADRDGVVTAVEAEAGQVVAAGQTVVRVAEGNEKEVVIAVPESEVPKVHAASAFTVTLGSVPGRSWQGRLREFSPSADPATRTFAVRISVPEADESVRLGMSASVGVGVKNGASALRLPLSAFYTRDDRPNVWVVDPASGTVKLTRVETDGVVGNEMRVKAGLRDGMLVVTAGAGLLEPGQKVRLPEERK